MKPMSRFSTALGASLVSAALLAGLPAGVYAGTSTGTAATTGTAAAKTGAKLAKKKAFLFGTLTAIAADKTSATVTSPVKGAVTIKLTAKTRFVGHTAAAKQAGVQVNDQVAVVGAAKTDTARVVRFDTVAFPLPARVRLAGVATATATGLSVTAKSGKTFTVTFGPKTHFRVNGQKATALPALAAGQTVRVKGRPYTDGTVRAGAVILRAK